jgi:hypothetical protein
VEGFAGGKLLMTLPVGRSDLAGRRAVGWGPPKSSCRRLLAFVCKWNAVGASSAGAIGVGVPTRRAGPLTCSIAELFKYPVDFVALARGLFQSVPVRQILERPASPLVPCECLSEVRGAKEKSAATHFFSLSLYFL